MHESYILLFIFAGIAWIGIGAVALAVFVGIRRLVTPKPQPETERWTRDWQALERDFTGYTEKK